MAERRATAMRWWAEGFKKPARTIHGIVKRLAEDGRRKKYDALESIYAEAVMSPSISNMIGSVFGHGAHGVWQRTPVIRSAIDTQANRLFRARPRPRPTPKDGDWHVEQRARLLDTWLDGNFERLGMHDALARRVGLDGLILGIGAIKGFGRDGAPVLERVWPGDLHVDKREEKYGCVRTLYQSTAVDREVLIEAYPDFEAEILDAPEYDDPTDADGDQNEASDLVEVIEAWRLPSGRDDEGYCTGGIHYITIDGRGNDANGTILNPDDTDWDRETFPFAFFRYRDRPRSFWGLGIAETSACMQADLNNLDEVLSEAYYLMTPGILAHTGSIPKKTFTNEVGKVIEYEGVAPVPWVPPAVSPDFLQRGDSLEQRIYRMEGISLMSSQSMKPSGLDSGAALTAHEDIEAERHALPGQAYEQLFVDAANLLIDVANDIAKDESIPDKKKLCVLGGRELLEEIDFADAQLDRDEYVLRVWPVSRLSRSLTGQLEEVSRMAEMGAISDPDDILEMLNLPDLERSTSLRLGGRRLVRKIVDNCLRGKEAVIHPYLPLDYLVKHATEVRADAELKGAPDSALESLNTLIGAAIDEQKKAIAATTPPMPPAPAMPPAPMMPVDPMAGAMPAGPMPPAGPVPMPVPPAGPLPMA